MIKELLYGWRYSPTYDLITSSCPGLIKSKETICDLKSGMTKEEKAEIRVLLLNTPKMFNLLTAFMKQDWYKQPVLPSLTVECKICGGYHDHDSSFIDHKSDCIVGNTEDLLEVLNNVR